MKRIVAKTQKVFFPSNQNDYKPYILKPRNLFVLAIILLVIKFLLFSWFFYYPRTTQFAVVISSKLVELVNQERTAAGLEPLKINERLVQAAQQKAQDMVSHSYFAHTSPSGITPWYWFDKVGYDYIAAGENLAKDFTESTYLHQAWMNSPSHKNNILNKNYQEIGIAVVEGEINGKNTVLAVQMFGKLATKKIEKPEVKQPAPSQVAVSPQEQEVVSPSVESQKTGSLKTTLPDTFLNTINKKSEPIVKDIYFIIAGLLSLVLLLTIFVNIRVQYPRLIFTVLIFIILIIGIASFNGQEFLNKGIDIL
ncbi:MAG: CAP domain-containing protein [Patescibacteria group bacterium]